MVHITVVNANQWSEALHNRIAQWLIGQGHTCNFYSDSASPRPHDEFSLWVDTDLLNGRAVVIRYRLRKVWKGKEWATIQAWDGAQYVPAFGGCLPCQNLVRVDPMPPLNIPNDSPCQVAVAVETMEK